MEAKMEIAQEFRMLLYDRFRWMSISVGMLERLTLTNLIQQNEFRIF